MKSLSYSFNIQYIPSSNISQQFTRTSGRTWGSAMYIFWNVSIHFQNSCLQSYLKVLQLIILISCFLRSLSEIEWKNKHGFNISTNNKYRTSQYGRILHVMNVTYEDEGKFACVTENNLVQAPYLNVTCTYLTGNFIPCPNDFQGRGSLLTWIEQIVHSHLVYLLLKLFCIIHIHNLQKRDISRHQEYSTIDRKRKLIVKTCLTFFQSEIYTKLTIYKFKQISCGSASI